MKNSMNRRAFIQRTGVATLGLSLATYLNGAAKVTAQNAARSIGANDRINVAVIGTNGRGLSHIGSLALPGVELACICDVDDKALAKGVKAASKRQANPKGVKDFRKVLEDKTIDAITIATPDHWHAPMAILALQAGKHVYVEKPCSHNPHEGELLVQAVSKYGRICQMGNQRRSAPSMQQVMKELREGIIGKPYFARAWYDNSRKSIGRGKEIPVPANLDYELWQGPAPRKPYRSNLVHYNWHWFWHWGTGEALNNGTHEVDVARWALGVDWPIRVSSNGGRYCGDDDWETPDTQVISWDYADGKTISWEGRSCNPLPAWAAGSKTDGALTGLQRGALIYGTEGAALLDNGNYTIFDNKGQKVKEIKSSEVVDPTDTVSGSGAGMDKQHMANFIQCIRDGKAPNSPITEGHKSVTMLHLGNIASRVGRGLSIDPANGHIKGDDEAMKLWQRQYEPGWEPKV